MLILFKYRYVTTVVSHNLISKHDLLLKCSFCGRGFPLGSLLERHVRTHTQANRITCPYCSKSFGSKVTYNNHLFSKHLGKQIKESNACLLPTLFAVADPYLTYLTDPTLTFHCSSESRCRFFVTEKSNLQREHI